LQGRYSWLVVAVALVIGGLIGFGATTLSYRYGWLRLPGERPLQRMTRVLKLTPTQREQVEQVMEETRDKVFQTRHNFRSQRRELFVDAYRRIRKLLTPEQQKIFANQFVPPRIREEGDRIDSRENQAPRPSVAPTPLAAET